MNIVDCREAILRQAWHAQVKLAYWFANDSDQYARRVTAFHRVLGVPRIYAERGLVLHRECGELVAVPCGPGGRYRMMAMTIHPHWLAMQAQAAAAGITLLVKSAFRPLEEQAFIVRERLALGVAIGEILACVAAPGYSEHHSGRALDIGTVVGDDDFESSLAFQWLVKNAGRFGFALSYPRGNRYGVVYEPWHWYWRG